MESLIEQLAEALRRALSSSEQLPPNALRQFTDTSPLPLSPWAVWLLFSLVRHDRRQQWVAEIAATKLGADLAAISVAGAFGHPPIEQRGLVPDLTDWEYHFHGRGCCLTNRISGETIDVDFYDGSAEWIDPYFFMWFLQSLKEPPFVERRLISLHPTLKTIQLAFGELRECELLERRGDSKSARLASNCRELADQIDQLDAACRRPDQCLKAGIALGDWFLVQEHAENDSSVTKEVKRCVEDRCHRLDRFFAEPETRWLALQAFNDLNVPEAQRALEIALLDPPNGSVSAALEIIGSRANDDWTDEVRSVLRRTNPNGDIPETHIWLSCADYLLRRSQNVADVRRGLSRMVTRELGDAAVLALELLPECAIELFRKALRSSVPNDRMTAAAALAILDQPWSQKELSAVLSESGDQQATAECRAALRASPHADLHEIVREWEASNPHEAEPGPFISMDEMALRTADTWLEHEMEKLHDRVLPLRKRVVPASRRSWWPF